MDKVKHAVPVLSSSPLADIVEKSSSTINVGMSITGEIFKIVEIVDLYDTTFYVLLHKNEPVVISTQKRFIDLLFVDMTGMSTE